MNGELRAGLIIILPVVLMVAAALLGLAGDYNRMHPDRLFLPPAAAHPLGTDNFGRDVLARVVAGSRHTVLLALATVAGALVAGTALGLLAGYSGGLRDEAVMRLMDAVSSFPGILLALVMVALMGDGRFSLFVALLVLFIPGFARIARSGALQLRHADFILAERLLGAGSLRIVFAHILPNLSHSLLSAAAVGLSNAILAESAMSYLGLGIQPPHPSWGRMLSESQIFLFNAPWCAVAPGAFIMLTVVGFHCIGNGLRRRFGG